MKIAVCFKVTTDYDKLSPLELKKGDFSYVKKSIGFFDEGALELALRYKDENDCYLEAVTYSENDEIVVSKLYSLGFDKVTVINGKEELLSSKDTAFVLSNYLKDKEFDLILTGEMVGPNDTGSVPYHLGRLLNIHVLPNITYFDNKNIYEEGILKSKIYDLDRYVLVVSNAKYSYLRFPKYTDIENTKDKKANIINANVNRNKNKKKKALNILEKKDIKFISSKEIIDRILEVQNDL